MSLHPRRRESDFSPAQAAIDILRDTSVITHEQMRELLQMTIKRHQLSAENMSLVVNELALQADRMADTGWWGMDCVAAGLEEAAGCLPDVRGPGHEQRDAEEERHQRELRQWAYERSL